MRDNKTLLHRLSLWAQDTPDAPAHYFKDENEHWKSISAKSFWEQVCRIAEALQKNGLHAGDRVVIYAGNAPEWVQWDLGIALAGGISVGVHPQAHTNDLKHMIAQTKPKMIITEADAYRAKLLGLGAKSETILLFSQTIEWLTEHSTSEATTGFAERALNQFDPKQTSFLIYTSGTTAFPRGVMLGMKQLTLVADMISREWNLPFFEGTLFSFLPFAHIAEKIQCIAVAITNRYPVWFNSKFDHFSQELKDVRPTMMLGVPRVWERIKEQVEAKKPGLFSRMKITRKLDRVVEEIYLSQVKEQLGLDRLLVAVSGAAKLPPAVAKWYERIGIEIAEIYGMSESCGLITMSEKVHSNWDVVGRAPHGIDVKVEKNGEIWVRGEHLFNGYFEDPVETHAVLVEGWLRTGDLGEWTEDHELKIVGRDREILKLASGKMVAPVPIENALKELPEVSNACVMGDGKTSLLALITLKDDVLMRYKFIPGAIEGLSVEAEELKKLIRKGIDDLLQSGTIKEKIPNFVILSRDFLFEEKEITLTQKLNRTRIRQNFKYFLDQEV